MNSHPGRAKPRYPWNSYGFSEREEQIARCVATGLSNKEIADALFIREQTVKHHVSSILIKTGAKDRFEVALWMISQDQEREKLRSNRTLQNTKGHQVSHDGLPAQEETGSEGWL